MVDGSATIRASCQQGAESEALIQIVTKVMMQPRECGCKFRLRARFNGSSIVAA